MTCLIYYPSRRKLMTRYSSEVVFCPFDFDSVFNEPVFPSKLCMGLAGSPRVWRDHGLNLQSRQTRL